MIVGNFNIHQILFSLEMFDSKQDKLGYLYQTRKELERIIRGFESNKSLPLKMYANDYTPVDDNCPELKQFIKKHYKRLNKNPWDTRDSIETGLKKLLTSEIIEYKKIVLVIDGEIRLLEKSVKSTKEATPEPRNITVNTRGINFSYVASLVHDNVEKIIWKFTIGELIELVMTLSHKKLIKDLADDNIPKYIVENFVDENQKEFPLEKVKKVYSMFLITNLAKTN